MNNLFDRAPEWVNYAYQTIIGSVYWLENEPYTKGGLWSGRSEQIKESGFGIYETNLIKREKTK